MKHSVHPTRELLIETAVKLLENHQPDEISIEMVLTTSGVSHGSLYHHFKDFGSLIDAAQVERFSGYVDASIALLTQAVTTAKTREELIAAIRNVTLLTQSANMLTMRLDRTRALAASVTREDFRALLGAEQERLTGALADLVREAQSQGWYRPELDPIAVAVFIQSYTIGKIVDDVTTTHMSQENWNSLINDVIERTFLTEKA